ncbi:MAG TPA: ORF6N domain-containing protein [Steroidobacteraceae bacterium]|nr:ORF6N domain-containing protein [Steroidobacteraceae bacterium]
MHRATSNSVERITHAILVLRGQRVILDSDLAAIYGVTTGRLNEAVKRNAERFPEDFMLRLSAAEHVALISQTAISNPGRGGRRKLPWAFTEHGAMQADSLTAPLDSWRNRLAERRW